MTRPIFEVDDLTIVNPKEPVRLRLSSPLRGGPKLSDVRAHLTPRGKLRFSSSGAFVFVDFTPGEVEAPFVALDTIVRSDPKGLERMLRSALPHVDQIVLGVDARSDEETFCVAHAYADVVHVFGAVDLGLTEGEWAAERFDFAAARNLGRARVAAPWTLVLDSDEYIQKAPEDLREMLKRLDAGGAFALRPNVVIGQTNLRDAQRVARTSARWSKASHNQLGFPPDALLIETDDLVIVHDTSLRPKKEVERRSSQRRLNVEELKAAADGWDLHAIYHYAKQKIGDGFLPEAAKYTHEFRSFAEPRGLQADDRAHLAIGVSELYYYNGDFASAELWAFRALLDGPRIEAFCLLGDICEDRDALEEAWFWYECACLAPVGKKMSWGSAVDLRWGRREGLRRALKKTVGEIGFLVPLDENGKPTEGP